MAKIQQSKMKLLPIDLHPHCSAISLLALRASPGYSLDDRHKQASGNVNYISEFKICLLPLQDFSLAPGAAGQWMKSSLCLAVPREGLLPTGWCYPPWTNGEQQTQGLRALWFVFVFPGQGWNCPEPLTFLSIAGCAGTVQVEHKVSLPALVLLVTYLIYPEIKHWLIC